ncbi:negative transcriptional regulator [Sulfitobacter alexandrii]|uniref:Negative transcriptional regulator n=1 Tax=Sulfitobacter alexandrii TaxID=1917485 RepID=A0A1J0WCN6_9RHOB|nr:FMN-binding negative transcriptional regulator [Sulfitobacter alexandrii]APE42069.1 negative transcriptional regulator [Sulfitobacter alexandrii]
MHPNPVFHDADTNRNLAFARERGFGVLAASVSGAPLLSHVPFLLGADGTTADLHLVRSNPIARALDAPLEVTLAVSGGDSYVSPDWYGLPDQVPTWNYVAVHLTGSLVLRPMAELRDLLDRQSAGYEARLLPKTPWTTAKMTPEVMDRLMRMIVPCRLHITTVDGTWKLGQNKPDAVRRAAADSMDSHGFGSDVGTLADWMRAPRPK